MIRCILKFPAIRYGLVVRWLSCAVFITVFSSAVFSEGPGEVQIQKCWSHVGGTGSRSALAAFGGTIYSVRNGSVVEALSFDSGKLTWSNDVGGSIASNLIADGNNLFFVRRSGGVAEKSAEASLISISANAGITRWKIQIQPGDDYRLALTGAGLLAINSSGDALVVSAADGAILSNRKMTRPIGLGILDLGQGSIISSVEREILKVDGNEEPQVLSRSDFAVTALLLEAGGGVFYGNDRGILAFLSGKGQRPVWQFKSGGAISDIILTDGRVIAASNDNFVYALATANGARLWKRRVTGRVSALKMVGNDLLLVQPLGDDNIIFLNIKNGSVSGQIPATPGDFVLDSAVIDSNRLAIATDSGLYGYSIGGCGTAK